MHFCVFLRYARREIEYYAIGVNDSYFACVAACLQMEINK